MSADNGIYVLKTPDNETGKPEYRVAHIQGIDNLEYDESGRFVDTDDVSIVNARVMWKGCKVFVDDKKANEEAVKLAEECPVLEYGICYIDISNTF